MVNVKSELSVDDLHHFSRLDMLLNSLDIEKRRYLMLLSVGGVHDVMRK